ncbi:MAG: trehalase family glycosidase [Armatimonadota bacterium]|nr:trehalase family glycosidase [Armatimonadota bacterium]
MVTVPAWLNCAVVIAGCAAIVFSVSPAALAGDKEKLRRNVRTEDPKLNLLVEKLYNDCVFSKLFDPKPPALPNKWFSPGGGYVGQWIWDTMFVLNAYAPAGDDEVIRGVFDNYWHTIDNNPNAPKGSPSYGMVPNFLRPWPPLGYSQIPILAWGCEMVYRQTNDRKLIERCLPYLVIFDEWYSTERDVDGDGLIEYGAYFAIGGSDIVQTARYETFDFEPTLDGMKMTKHPKRDSGGEWYGNIDGVDQTCFLLMSERAIVRMARELGKTKLAGRYEKIITRRVKAIRDKMWDPKTKFFYSLDRDTDVQIPVKTIQGFLTLTCGAATKEQASALVEQLRDPKQWWCAYPVPTVAIDAPKFSAQGFWRGDMWPPTTYLVLLGLNRYGYNDEAQELTGRMRKLIGEKGINERYDATTGQPLGVEGLGMSCSAWLMMVNSLYGVQEDFRTIRAPTNPSGRRLTLGKLEVEYPSNDSVELRTGFKRQFRVEFPAAKSKLKPTITRNGQPLARDQVTVSGRAVVFTAEPGRIYRVRRGVGR